MKSGRTRSVFLSIARTRAVVGTSYGCPPGPQLPPSGPVLTGAGGRTGHAVRDPLFAPAPDGRRAGGAAQEPGRTGARRDGPARGPPGRARHARPAPARRVRVAVRLLPRRPQALRSRGVQPHRGGAGRAALPARSRPARLRRREPHDRPPSRPPPHLREPPPRPRLRPREDAAGGRGARRPPGATARRGREPAEAAAAAGGGRFGRAPARREPRSGRSRTGRSRTGRSRSRPGRCEPASRGTGRDDPGQRPAAAPARDRSARARSLPVPGDDRGRDPREAAARPRHAAPRQSLGGRRGDPRPRPHVAPPRPREGEVRGHGRAPSVPRNGPGLAPHSRRGPAGRLAAGPRVLRVRRGGGPSLQGARLRGVPPRPAVRGGRSPHRRQHPAAVPTAQRLRGAGVLRADRRRAGRAEHAGADQPPGAGDSFERVAGRREVADARPP